VGGQQPTPTTTNPVNNQAHQQPSPSSANSINSQPHQQQTPATTNYNKYQRQHHDGFFEPWLP
jgi:hypothetical protein